MIKLLGYFKFLAILKVDYKKHSLFVILLGIIMGSYQETSVANEFEVRLLNIMPLHNITPDEQIEWLDDQRLVFTGFSHEQLGISIFRWDMPNQVERIFENSKRFCFDRKNLYVIGRDHSKELKRFIISPPQYSSYVPLGNIPADLEPSFFDEKTCTEKKIPKALSGHVWAALNEGHGYLDFGPLQPTGDPIRLTIVGADGESRTDTSLLLKKPILPSVIYLPHKSTYFIQNINLSPEDRQQWRENGYIHTWMIKDNGSIDTKNIPSGKWVSDGGNIIILSAKDGFVIVSQGFERNGTSETAGAYYIYQDGRSQQLISGFVDNPRISPDGCKLAFAFQKNFDLETNGRVAINPSRKLIIINLCN